MGYIMQACYPTNFLSSSRCTSGPILRQQALGNVRIRSQFFGTRLSQTPGLHTGSQRRCRSKSAQASFFGVGAPEAVVVGLVAVVIFGPQGLAEAAKSLGQTVKAIKPTYDELMSTSQDMKSTLETSLGIDDVRRSLTSVTDFDNNNMGTTATSSQSFRNEDGSPKFSLGGPGSSNDSSDPDLDDKRAKAANLAWGDSNGTENSGKDGSQDHKATDNLELDSLSLDDLQAELARRKQQAEQPKA